jgi:hypothetical protein
LYHFSVVVVIVVTVVVAVNFAFIYTQILFLYTILSKVNKNNYKPGKLKMKLAMRI